MKTKKKKQKKKVKRLWNLNDKEKFAVCFKNLKQALNHVLILKKTYRVLKFNQNICLKEYIDLNA